jgi:8-oxo-dGTP diphosphatase
MEYVLGFRFRGGEHREVALILKAKPDWQKGKLNGIGGKVEPTDEYGPHQAMAREFMEETSVHTAWHEWRKFGTLRHAGEKIHLFASNGDCDIRQTTIERPGWYPVALLSMLPIMKNLKWLVPLAMDIDLPVAEIVDLTPIPA